MKEKFNDFMGKLKKMKNKDIILAIVLVGVLIGVYVLFSLPKNTAKEKNVENLTLTEQLEVGLSQILSQISGAGEVMVMISFDGTSEIITADTTNTHENSSSNGGAVTNTTKTETKTPIIVNKNGSSEVIVLKEILPDIKGVVVVAKGAKDMKVKLEILRAVQTLLKINANSIEVFAMK